MLIHLKMLNKYHKKGFAYNTLMMLFFYFVIIFFVAGLLYFFVYGVVGNDISTTDLTVALFLDQLYELPAVVTVVHDETGRVQSSTIDLERFSSSELERDLAAAFTYEEQPRLAAELRLQQFDGKPVRYQGTDVLPVYYQQSWYGRWKVLTGSMFRGSGGVDRYIDKRVVTLVTDTGKQEQGLLIVTVLIP